jgi:hypothetical protein
MVAAVQELEPATEVEYSLAPLHEDMTSQITR